jgi:hypothetical protein
LAAGGTMESTCLALLRSLRASASCDDEDRTSVVVVTGCPFTIRVMVVVFSKVSVTCGLVFLDVLPDKAPLPAWGEVVPALEGCAVSNVV